MGRNKGYYAVSERSLRKIFEQQKIVPERLIILSSKNCEENAQRDFYEECDALHKYIKKLGDDVLSRKDLYAKMKTKRMSTLRELAFFISVYCDPKKAEEFRKYFSARVIILYDKFAAAKRAAECKFKNLASVLEVQVPENYRHIEKGCGLERLIDKPELLIGIGSVYVVTDPIPAERSYAVYASNRNTVRKLLAETGYSIELRELKKPSSKDTFNIQE